jgi:hypothetical protein
VPDETVNGSNFFYDRGFLAGLDNGLVSLRRACYWLVRAFGFLLIPLAISAEGGGSGIRGLGFGIRADNG